MERKSITWVQCLILIVALVAGTGLIANDAYATNGDNLMSIGPIREQWAALELQHLRMQSVRYFRTLQQCVLVFIALALNSILQARFLCQRRKPG